MPTNYTGITIGPIGDTMGLTSSPAGLWGASYFFSYIARELCKVLVDGGVPVENFIAPFFLIKDGELILSEQHDDICEKMRDKGVGLLHDRIIFRSEDIPDALGKVRTAREKIVAQLAEKLNASFKEDYTEWLKNYLRISSIQLSVKNNESPLIYLGKKLSAIELEPQFSSRQNSIPLLSLFENPDKTSGSKNAVLKNSFLCKEFGNEWMLFKPRTKNIKALEDIAICGADVTSHKYQQYYAVLKSDGDSMSKILENLSSDQEIREYSRKCLTFCAKGAELIQGFGGMPIYAGGDDLLALLPVVEKNGKSIFALIEDLRIAFNENFKEEREALNEKPTISFGVAIQFYKSPLYEALERADSMLRSAKNSEIKNACFLNLQKHSGQTIQFFEYGMDGPEMNLFATLESLYHITTGNDPEKSVAFLSSAGYQVETFRSMFFQAVKNKAQRHNILVNLFNNLFDNADQKQFQPYLEKLIPLTELIFEEQEGTLTEEDQKRCVNLTCAAIRAIHFLNESKEED